MRWLAVVSLPFGWVVAQVAPPADPAPIVQWGVAGVLLTFILWLYMDERREHKALRKKVVDDVLPAILANNEQMRNSAEALRNSAPLDPKVVADWTHTLRRVERKLDQ